MPVSRFRLGRRWRIALICVFSIVVILLLAIRLAVAPILSHELVSLIEARLNAKLTLGDVFYHPPYGLSLKDCRLTFIDPKGQDVDLIDFTELSVSLAELPIHGGPLQIQDLTIRGPVIHLIKTADGIEGQIGLLKPDNTPTTPNHLKLSDILRLRKVAIEDGEVVYEDQTGPIKHPFAWNGIDIHVATQAQSTADYDFNVDATTGALSSLKAEGGFNVDDLSADVKKYAVSVALAGGTAPRQLPPELQALLERYRVKGNLLLQGSASGSLSAPGQSQCTADFSLHDAAAFSPEVNGWLDALQLEIKASADAHGGKATIATFSATTGGVQLSLKSGATILLDPNAQTWTLKGLAGSVTADAHATEEIASHGLLRLLNPDGTIEFSANLVGPLFPSVPWSKSPGQVQLSTRNFTLHPPGCVAPVTISTGPVRLVGDIISVRDVQARYGGDLFTLSSARIPLPPISHRVITCNEIIASLSVHPNGLPYPAPLHDLMAQFQPGGHYSVSGMVSADFNNPPPALNYDVLVSGDNGVLNVDQIPITDISFDAEVKPSGGQLARLECKVLDGSITASQGKAEMHAPFAFSSNVFMKHIDLGQLDKILKASPPDSPVSGFADVQTKLSGSAPVNGKSFLDLLYAEGQFEVAKGNLWSIPAFKKIEESAKAAKDALTVGRAAAYFRISDQAIELQDAAVSSPLFGVMGYGTIAFAGAIDFHAIAVPLGDWRQRWGEIAGNVQEFLNSATSAYVYQVRVTGPVNNPQIDGSWGSALTNKEAQTVGNMVKQPNDQKPIDLLNKPSGGG